MESKFCVSPGRFREIRLTCGFTIDFSPDPPERGVDLAEAVVQLGPKRSVVERQAENAVPVLAELPVVVERQGSCVEDASCKGV